MRRKNSRVMQLVETMPKGSAVAYSIVVRRDAGEWLASCPELLINVRKDIEKRATKSCFALIRKRLLKDAKNLLSHVKALKNPNKVKDVLQIIRVDE